MEGGFVARIDEETVVGVELIFDFESTAKVVHFVLEPTFSYFCFWALRLGISIAAQYRQICYVGTLLPQP